MKKVLEIFRVFNPLYEGAFQHSHPEHGETYIGSGGKYWMFDGESWRDLTREYELQQAEERRYQEMMLQRAQEEKRLMEEMARAKYEMDRNSYKSSFQDRIHRQADYERIRKEFEEVMYKSHPYDKWSSGE